jgi:RNA polymerase sigma factor (sigma-70 family)
MPFPSISSRWLAAQSDERLIELVGEGSERAFEVLVGRYRLELLRYCARLGLSGPRAEDVLQHALLQAWLALRGAGGVRELRPWLYRVVHNAAVNAMRGSARDIPSQMEAAGLATVESPELELERRIAFRAALSEVAALPGMQRDAILLTAIEGRTHEEVASALGITHGAVRGLLYRARATLRGAAAAVIPQPLFNWAHGCLAKMGSTVEQLPIQGDGPAVLLKGAAVAATAVLVVGATVAPIHGHGAARVASSSAAGAARTTRASPTETLTRSPSGAEQGAGAAGKRASTAVRTVVSGAPRKSTAPSASSVVQVPTRSLGGGGSSPAPTHTHSSAPTADAPPRTQVSTQTSTSPAASSPAVPVASSPTPVGVEGSGGSPTQEVPKESSSGGGGSSGGAGSGGDDLGSGESQGSDDSHGGESDGGDSGGSGSDDPERGSTGGGSKGEGSGSESPPEPEHDS